MFNGGTIDKTVRQSEKTVKYTPQVLDVDLRNVPQSIDTIALKKLTGARHVIQANLDQDNFTGINTGVGRMTVRLNAGDDMEKIKANLQKAGI